MAMNFDLRVRAVDDAGQYTVEVISSPDGESPPVRQGPPPLPVELLTAWQEGHLGSAQARALGEALGAWLFPPPVAARLLASRRRLESRGEALRLRLRIEPASLSQLPWELCWNAEERFLALRPDLTWVRYSDQAFAPGDLAVPFPLRLVVALASPAELPALDVEAEAATILNSLAGVRDRIEVEVLRNATWEQLQSALAGGADALHFVGHGGIDESGEGYLAFEDEEGALHALSAESLYTLFQGRDVRAVVLNACQSALSRGQEAIMAVAPALVRSGVPAVLAQQAPVPDRIAKLFARGLYRYLASGKPLDETVTEMRIHAFGAAGGHAYWAIPVLFMRAPDGRLWHEKGERREERGEKPGGVTISGISNSQIMIGNVVGGDFVQGNAGEDDQLREEGTAEE